MLLLVLGHGHLESPVAGLRRDVLREHREPFQRVSDGAEPRRDPHIRDSCQRFNEFHSIYRHRTPPFVCLRPEKHAPPTETADQAPSNRGLSVAPGTINA